MELNKRLEIVFLIMFYLALFSFFFDVLISYNQFSKDKDYFINSEKNKWLVAELKDNIPFFQSTVIVLMFAMYVLTYFIYKNLKNEPKLKIPYFKNAIITILIITLIGKIFKHINGGISWLI